MGGIKLVDVNVIRSIHGSYVKDGNLRYLPSFDDPPTPREGTYKTICYHLVKDYEYPDDLNKSTQVMASRLLGVREDDTKLHNKLRRNQERAPRNLRAALDSFHKHIYSNTFIEDECVGHANWVLQPHAKRKLRLATEVERIFFLNDFKDDGTPVDIFPKNGEMLPRGKKRAVGSLGAYRTAYSAWAIQHLKAAMEVPFISGNYTLRFIASPRSEVLEEAFNWLQTPKLGECRYIYFSDDSCFSMGTKDGVYVANGDIKQCDGSHFDPLFNMFKNIFTTKHRSSEPTAYADAVNYALKQLSAPAQFTNKYKQPGTKRQKTTYNFNSARLYSGSVLTTVINNFANVLIALGMQKLCPDPSLLSRSQVDGLYKRGAASVGYLVKSQVCHIPEDIQFLKCFPAKDIYGCYRPVQCLGTPLKGFGLKDGDVPGSSKIPLETRCGNYLRGVVDSWVHGGNHELFRAFKDMTAQFKPAPDVAFGTLYPNRLQGEIHTFAIDALIPRYRCTVDEITDLARAVRQSRVGYVIKLPIIERIHRIDYG